MRYISIKKEEEGNVKTSFVLFKSEIDEEYKKEFTQAARTTIAEDSGENVSHDDYEFIWRWFIYRKLVETMENDSTEIFQRNLIYNNFKALINSPMDSSGNVKGSISLIPRIKKGNIIISKNPKFKLELEWDHEEKATISFNQLVRKADSEFSKLSAGEGSLDIFFDELELNHNTKKQYTRDARLIRDIIVTISKINATCKKKGFKILLYSAVRSEVQSAVDSLGKEINKVLGDFGTEIMWNRPGIDTSQQPLLNVVTKRLRTSLGKECESDSDTKIWELFFPEKIQNSETKSYILHHSWYRPRDIIRLLKIGQDQHPYESSFKHSVFDSIRKNIPN
ncbi:hypothetical protein BFC18_12145 [Alteromonas confluentis]|uniref:Uncharacterized protein n=1 Tax=Alteromonas confluentis TaxID=1656094 RepID=A0A1E7ZAF2_9ALTE|nr:hypothetical protein [Alteromonas confluentis]OFC70508.1 hypothetical protein BFC18_12145 [Alteromonas confluentis]